MRYQSSWRTGELLPERNRLLFKEITHRLSSPFPLKKKKTIEIQQREFITHTREL